MDFLHVCEAVYGVSKCKNCENLRLKTLSTRLEVFEKGSSIFPCYTPEASEALRESWGLDVGFKAMESEQMGLDLSLSLSHLSPHVKIHRLNSHMIIYVLAQGHAMRFPSG